MLERLRNVSFMEIALMLGATILLWVLWRIQRSPKSIDFVDLMIGPDGKASWSKMTAIGGFAIGTWIMVYQTLNARMTEFFFLIYYAICVGSPVAFAIIGRSNNPTPLPTTATLTVPSGQTASVQAGPTPPATEQPPQ